MVNSTRHSRMFLLALFLICAALLATNMYAQQVTAAITGTVTDPSGAPVNGATVTATDTARGTIWTAKTNEFGLYNLPRLPIGSYDVKAEGAGFQIEKTPTITLDLNQTARMNFQMKVGARSETVEVTAGAPLLQTESTEVSTVIDAATNVALPLASRNYIQLTLLAPGAVHPNPTSLTTAQIPDNAGRPYINGNREQANNFLLDGMDNNQLADNEVGYSPSVDAIQEFNLITQNASAEFGNFQGGIVSTSIKSGTNSYHGDIFEFFRNDKLNANSWANNIGQFDSNGVWSPLPKPKLRWNMFGGTVGGPIIKNKLFFFADYQGQRFDHPASTAAVTVFPTAFRQGNFSAICTAGFTAGLCNNAAQQLTNPFAGGAPFLNNQIPLTLLDPVAKNLFASPDYQATNSGLRDNFTNVSSDNLENDQGDIRIDYNMSSNDRISGRYSQGHQRFPTANSFKLFNPSFEDAPVRNGVINWTHTFSPTLLNEARVGVNYTKETTGNSDNGLGNIGEQLGINGGNAGAPGLLNIQFGSGTVDDLGSADVVQRFADTVMQFEDNVSITHGRHFFRTGFEFQRLRVNSEYSGNNGVLGIINFNGKYSGSDVSDFFLGLPNTVARGGANVEWGHRANLIGGYFQDDWRLTDTLTVNLGLRYENQTPWVEKDDHQVNFGEFSGQLLAPNCSLPELAGLPCNKDSNRALYNSYNSGLDFQPRIGIAWAPAALGGKTVVRAAYTLSSYSEGTGSNLRLPRNVPFSPAEIQNTNSLTTPFFTDAGIVGGSATDPFVGTELRVWAQDYQPAVAQQWNLSVQQQLTNSTTFQIGYVGQHGTHLANPMWLKQKLLLPDGTIVPGPFLQQDPTFKDKSGAIAGTFSNAGQRYDALQAVLRKRMGNGLEGQVAYTYSKCLTNSAGYYGAGWAGSQTSIGIPYWQNVYDGRSEWGPCYFDQTHVLSSYATYELPFGRHQKYANNVHPALNAVIGNWQLNGILSLHTGNAMTISSFDDPSGTGGFMSRPDCLGSVHYPENFVPLTPSGGGYVQWYDPSNFVAPAPGTFGNCSNGIARGPSLHTFDLGIQKSFPFGESRRLEFRSEFINFTNTPILNAPANLGVGGNLGQINTSQGERNIQFALKLYY